MLLFNSSPFFRITIVFLLGALLANELFGVVFISLDTIALIAFLQLALTIIIKLKFNKLPFITCLINLLLASFLCAMFNLKYKFNINIPHNIQAYEAVVSKDPIVKDAYTSAIVNLRNVKINNSWKPVSASIKIFIKENCIKLYDGDVIVISGSPTKIDKSSNSFGLDHAKVLINMGIHHTHFITSKQLLVTGKKVINPIINIAISIKKYFYKVVDEVFANSLEGNLLKAIIIGDKGLLNKSDIKLYSQTGTMHILAVSGLHVGIIFTVLSIVLKNLYFVKDYNILIHIVSIVLTWLYAIVAGLPPSSLRAAIMFTLFGVAKISHRDYNIVNALMLSILFTLLFNPLLINTISFQFSYMAVLGIVYINPLLISLIKQKYRNSYLIRSIFISLSAQMAVLPITIYYFHNLAIYFLLANIVVIPLVTLVLYCTLAIMLIYKVPMVSFVTKSLIFLLKITLKAMHYTVMLVNDIPYSNINDLFITRSTVIILYTLGVCLFFLIKNRHIKGIILLYFVICVFYILKFFKYNTQRRLIFYGIPNGIAYSVVEGVNSVNYLDGMVTSNKIENYIIPFQKSLHVKKMHLTTNTFKVPYIINSYNGIRAFSFYDKKIIVVNGKKLKFLQTIQPNTLISGNSKIDIDYLLLFDNVSILPLMISIFNVKNLILPNNIINKHIADINKLLKCNSPNTRLHLLLNNNYYAFNI